MIRGMAFLHRDEDSPTCGANFSSSSQCSLDGRTVIRYLNNLGREKHGIVRRRWPEQFDGVFRSHCARRAIFACPFHQMIRCRPVAMTIEQRADDPAVQNSLERFVFFLRFPLSDDFAVLQETANMQAVWICLAAAEANIFRCVLFLERFFFFHFVGRFCETSTERCVMQRRLTQTPYNLLHITRATRDMDAGLARRRMTAVE